MPFAARVGDMHVCPMVTPGVPPIPHVGGPILPPGMPTVFIGGMPAATVGSMCTCVGPPDSIIRGSFTVLIGGRPAARMGDNTAHGGVIVIGCPTVLIGDFGMPGMSGPVTPGMPDPFMAPPDTAGTTQDTSRKKVLDGMDGSWGVSNIPAASLNELLKSMPPEMARILKQAVTLDKAQENGAAWCDPCDIFI
jgi:uncharacterized Zn-binding protein involved in type VI secretion